MTRFTQESINFNYNNLDKQYLDSLILFLKDLIKLKKKEITDIINNFSKRRKHYEINELSQIMVILLRFSSYFSISINVGYPFPIYTEDISNEKGIEDLIKNNINIEVYLRGEILREKQRCTIWSILSKDFIKKKISNFSR